MSGNEDILEAKRKMPLPALMAKLGLRAHVTEGGRCPFADHPHPSFSVFQRDGNWFWKCDAGCGEGDEMALLAKVCSRLAKKRGASAVPRPEEIYPKLAHVTSGAAKPKRPLAAGEQAAGTSAADNSPPQTMSLGQVLDAVVGILGRYVVFPFKEQAEAIALFVVHTWTVGASDYTPYLFVHSAEKRSGKSRLLEVLNLLVRRPRFTPGGSSAALLRSIDENDPPTILLDEIDAVYSKKNDSEAESLRQFLNAGFKRGSMFLRCVGQGSDQKPKEFPAFCPKVLAGIGKCLPDTVRDRSLPIELKRQAREERAERFREREAKGVIEPTRAALEALAERPGLLDALRQARPALPDELNDRQQDITEPLVAIADQAGGEWPERARAALVKLCAQEEDASIEVQLLADIKGIYHDRRADKLPTMEMLERLVAIEDDRPWALWWEDALDRDKPKGPAARLAKMLKRFKIKPCKIRMGEETVQGYRRADFLDAWKRYLPAPSPPFNKNGTNGTDGTKPESTRENIRSDFAAATLNVPTSPTKDGTRIHDAKRTNVPSVPSVPSLAEGEPDGTIDVGEEDSGLDL
jgi:hypothetical protein